MKTETTQQRHQTRESNKQDRWDLAVSCVYRNTEIFCNFYIIFFCINVTKESYTWVLHKANKFFNCFVCLGTVPQISVWSRGKKKKNSIKVIGWERNSFCTKCYLLQFPKSSSTRMQNPHGLFSSSLPCCHVIPPSSDWDTELTLSAHSVSSGHQRHLKPLFHNHRDVHREELKQSPM